MTMFHFHTTVPTSGTVTLPVLPPEFLGEPVKIVVEKEPTEIPSQEDTAISIDDFLKKYTGILKNCNIESVEVMKADRVNYILEKYQ